MGKRNGLPHERIAHERQKDREGIESQQCRSVARERIWYPDHWRDEECDLHHAGDDGRQIAKSRAEHPNEKADPQAVHVNAAQA